MSDPSLATEYRERRRFGPRIALLVLVALVLVGFFSLRGLAVFYTDKLWFDDLGFGGTWRTLLVAKIVPALIFTTAMFVLMLASLTVADRIAPKFRNMGPEDEVIERYRNYVTPYAGRVRVGIAFVFAMLVGVGASSQWRDWVLFRNRVTWGKTDPQFHKDIGFYAFELPFLRFVTEWLFVVLVVVLLVTAVFHYLNGGIRFQAPNARVTPQVKAHLSVILALMAFTKTAQYYLGRYELVFSHRGAVDGATYTDVKAQLPALNFLVLISIVGAVLFIVNIWRRGFTLPIIAVGLWAFVSIVLGTAYPAYVQQFTVKPSQLDTERPYIARNIQATRAAFALDKIRTERFNYKQDLDAAKVKERGNAATIANVRLWDPRVLKGALQPQGFKSYYAFDPPQVDRYAIGDNPNQQVVVAGRELASRGIPNDTWVSKHLAYTHGYAAIVAAANQATGDKPSYVLSDLPPQGDNAVQIKSPFTDLYFGVGLDGYVIAGTKTGEVQPSRNGGETISHYKGDHGVLTSSWLRRAALAARFSDINLLFTDQLTSTSRALFARDITERVAKAAPFLRFDSHPNLVALPSGRLVWVIDAYTVTDRYPYSQEVRGDDVAIGSGLGSNYNYVRNSVKAVVDAYDGSVSMYVVDPSDPMVRVYRKAFPDLFSDADTMPAGLAPHLRYPTDLFAIQTRHYELYHMTKVEEFFLGRDQWTATPKPTEGENLPDATSSTPTDAASKGNDGGRSGRLRSSEGAAPIYETIQLPGETGQEFVVLRSYVPVSKDGDRDNVLRSFVVARSDGFDPKQETKYGELIAYELPADSSAPSLVQAATQIEADPAISKQLSLLRGKGSKTELGDVELVPVGNSILYVRPYYIVGSGQGPTDFPRLKYVAVTYGDESRLNDTVSDAVDAVFGVEAPSKDPSKNPTTGTIAELLAEADKEFEAYAKAVADGDFEAAGRHLDRARDDVARALKQAGEADGSSGSGSTSSSSPPSTTTPTTVEAAST